MKSSTHLILFGESDYQRCYRAVERAVTKLLYAGMTVRYRSRFGASFYLGWPGRVGLLRVSDHITKQRYPDDQSVVARITFSDAGSIPHGEKFDNRCAEALGRYLMKTSWKGNENG